MSPFLRALMGMQSAPETVGRGGALAYDDPIETQGNTMVVTGNRQPAAPVEDDLPPYYGNRPQLEAANNARMENEDFRKANPRKGMFGTKGTLRDILGVVGDAFLVQGGKNPLYMPQKRQEQLSDAMVGFTDDPLGAIERVTDLDPQFGKELQQLYETGELKRLQQDSLAQSRESAASAREYNIQKDFRGYVGQMLANEGAYNPDGTISEQALSLIYDQGRAAGVDPATLGIRPGMTKQQGSLMASGMTSTYNQAMIPQQERRTAVQERNAASNAVRANRPPQPRATPQPTDAAGRARVIDKMNRGQPLGKGDLLILRQMEKDATASPGRGRREVRNPFETPAPAAGTPPRRAFGAPRN